jgi:3-oxoadipate enol-lactonase
MFDQGSGLPIVVVQPLQGRWQWMRPFLDALSEQCRVVTYTLAGDFGADRPMDRARGFDLFVEQLEDAMVLARIDRAALCGISFGGTVAVRFAARYPERVTHLVIASSPGPGWNATQEQTRYVTRPLLTLPIFLWTAYHRLSPEMTAAFPHLGARAMFVAHATARALRYPAWPPAMAARVRLMQTVDLAADCARITAPTLVVTGEPSLDMVVPVASTKQYLNRIRDCRYEMMDRTGHSGSLTQPERLARIVGTFVNASHS